MAGFVRGLLHISDVLVRPLGAQLTVAVTFQADLAWPLPLVRGVVKVSATPVYDGETQSLRLGDVSITGDVDHVLARAALAFKRRDIIDALNDFSFDLEPVLRDLHRLNASLSGHGVAPNAALQGQVETMRVDDILVAEELIVVASASGQLRVIMDPRVGSQSS
ncbi:MAG: DUF4403 family protein [Thioalkalivibrio sp.]|nr:DUF4403 family protein [Thioalkalivibrio sp.]